MIEILFQFLGEFLLQLFAELLIQLGVHAVAEPTQRRPRPWLAAIGYFLIGAFIGGLSLLVMRSHFVTHETLRIANLILTPVAAGVCMSAVGAWRARRGHALLRIDRFAYGYLFALAFALVRFALAR